MSEGTINRRWFRFGLRTMFVAVTLAGFLAWWVHRNMHQLREREQFLEWADENNVEYGVFKPPDAKVFPRLPLTWRMLGAKRVDTFIIDPPVPASTVERLKAAFPESDFTKPEDWEPPELPRQSPPSPLP